MRKAYSSVLAGTVAASPSLLATDALAQPGDDMVCVVDVAYPGADAAAGDAQKTVHITQQGAQIVSRGTAAGPSGRQQWEQIEPLPQDDQPVAAVAVREAVTDAKQHGAVSDIRCARPVGPVYRARIAPDISRRDFVRQPAPP